MNFEVNKIYHEPQQTSILESIPDEFIDLTVTSPPYSNVRDYDGKIGKVKYGVYSFPFEEMATELYRITKEGGVVVWVVNDQYVNKGRDLISFTQALYFQQLGFLMHDIMIYQKNGSSFPSQNRYYQVYEYMFVMSKNDSPKSVSLFKDKPNRWAGFSNFGKPSSRGKDGKLKKETATWYLNLV